MLERDGIKFRLSVEPVPGRGFDVQAAIAGMCAATGSWADGDVEALKEQLYRAREEGTRSEPGT